MAVKGKGSVKSAPAKSAKNDEATKGKAVMIFLPRKLHARTRLACIALGVNTSTVVRGLLAEWCNDKKKEIASVISGADDNDEEEDTEVEDAEVDSDEDEDEDE